MCGLRLSCSIEVKLCICPIFLHILGIDLVYKDFSESVGIEIESKFTLVFMLSCMIRGQTMRPYICEGGTNNAEPRHKSSHN